jgi:hypothetical protein
MIIDSDSDAMMIFRASQWLRLRPSDRRTHWLPRPRSEPGRAWSDRHGGRAATPSLGQAPSQSAASGWAGQPAATAALASQTVPHTPRWRRAGRLAEY